MQIYSKSMKNATSLSFLGRFWFCLFYLIGLGAGFKTSTQNFEIHYFCKFMQIYSKSTKNATSLFLGRFWFCLFYLIGLGGGFKTSTFWNSLIMQIYANLFKINEKCHLSSSQKSQQICTSGGDVYYASRNLLFTCFQTYINYTVYNYTLYLDKVFV